MNIVDHGLMIETRSASLYHGTSLYAANKAITDNILDALTEHRFLGGSVKGVSLTRSKATAMDFGPVVIELNQRDLCYNHRVLPLDFWGKSPEPSLSGIGRRRGRYAEHEEFVIGDITNLSRFVKSIQIYGQNALKQLHLFDALANHPLLSV